MSRCWLGPLGARPPRQPGRERLHDADRRRPHARGGPRRAPLRHGRDRRPRRDVEGPPAGPRRPRRRGLSFLVSTEAEWVAGLEVESSPTTVTFSDPGKNTYVALQGAARTRNDRARIAELWNVGAAAYFDGMDNPTVRVLEVTVSYGEYWDGPDGRLGQALNLIKAAWATRTPASRATSGSDRRGARSAGRRRKEIRGPPVQVLETSTKGDPHEDRDHRSRERRRRTRRRAEGRARRHRLREQPRPARRRPPRDSGATAAGSNAEAVEAADVVVLAVPHGAVAGIVAELGDALDRQGGRRRHQPAQRHYSDLTTSGISAAEQLQQQVPGATSSRPSTRSSPPATPPRPRTGSRWTLIAGDNAHAKAHRRRAGRVARLPARRRSAACGWPAPSRSSPSSTSRLNAGNGWTWQSAFRLVGPQTPVA